MKMGKLVLPGLALALAFGPTAMAQGPTLEERVEEACVRGLGWLAEQQAPDGSWLSGCDSVGYTGMAVLVFEDRALNLGVDPLSEEFEYSPQVQAGLDFIVSQALTEPIEAEPAGDPDGNGNGLGVYFDACGSHKVYATGVAMMALAASQHPELYGDMLQDAVDWMSWAQADPECGVHRGGWRYWPDACDSDNSISGYATLGLGFAQAAPPHGFGLTVPQWVKDELDLWIDAVQDDVDGDDLDGGSWYVPGSSPWVNILKTGNLIYEMGLVGDTAATPRVQDALAYIARHWNDTGGGTGQSGWLDHCQAMFTMMKGLESLSIDRFEIDGTSDAEWFPLVADHLIDTQFVTGTDVVRGHWGADPWGNEVISTSWALLTLQRSVPSFQTDHIVRCSVLGDAADPAEIDMDVFTFMGSEGEEIVVTLESEEGAVGRASLMLADAIEGPPYLFAIDRSPLPNEVSKTLKETGEYRIGICGHHISTLMPGKAFLGPYCLTVTSTQGAAGTLQPTDLVEDSVTPVSTGETVTPGLDGGRRSAPGVKPKQRIIEERNRQIIERRRRTLRDGGPR